MAYDVPLDGLVASSQSAMRMYDGPSSGLTSPLAFQLAHASERAHADAETRRSRAVVRIAAADGEAADDQHVAAGHRRA